MSATSLHGVSIVGLGAITPVGLSAPATFSALHAGIARLGPIGSSSVGSDGLSGAPLIGGRVPLELLASLPEGEESDYPGHRALEVARPAPLASYIDDGPERLATMVRLVVEEAAADAAWSARHGAEDDAVAVWLAVDPADGDEPSRIVLAAACAAGLADRGLALGALTLVAEGRSGALSALGRASEAAHGRAGRALVVGVGSWIRPREVDQLAAFGNLRSGDKPLGILPGECAAAIALGAGSGEMPTLGALALANEPAPPGAPTDARALSRVLGSALDAIGGPALAPLVVCDLNGDRGRALEWTIALPRALDAGMEDLWHPADAIGDAGAGLGALTLAWAAWALVHAQTEASRALCWAADDSGARAAVTLTIRNERAT